MALTQVSKDGVKNDAIDASKLPANSVGASELADNAVDTNAIESSAVTNAKLADNAITSAKIANSAVTNSKLGDDSVTGSRIADNAVATEHITNGSVTAAKLASGVQTTINNNADNRVITGSGTANTLNGESNVVVDANGNLGVGTTTPKNNSGYGGLTLDGSSGSLLSLLQNGTENLRIFGDSNPALQFEGALRLFSGVSGGSAIWGISPNGTTTGANSVSFNLKSTIQHTVGVVSISSTYNSGDLYVRIDNLYNLPGNAWWTFSFLLLSNQVEGGLGGHHNLVTNLNLYGLGSWSGFSTNNIVGSCSASINQHGSNFVEVQFDFSDSSRGANTVICNGGTFDPPRISFH